MKKQGPTTHEHAVALGRLGGKARSESLSEAERKAIATKASKAAKKWRAENPERTEEITAKAVDASRAARSANPEQWRETMRKAAQARWDRVRATKKK